MNKGFLSVHRKRYLGNHGVLNLEFLERREGDGLPRGIDPGLWRLSDDAYKPYLEFNIRLNLVLLFFAKDHK